MNIHIFVFCPMRSVVLKFISKEINRAEHKYMNIHPPPIPNYHYSFAPYQGALAVKGSRGRIALQHSKTRSVFTNADLSHPWSTIQFVSVVLFIEVNTRAEQKAIAVVLYSMPGLYMIACHHMIACSYSS